MAAAVARSSMRPGCCLSSSESQDLTVCLLKTREILFQHALLKYGSNWVDPGLVLQAMYAAQQSP